MRQANVLIVDSDPLNRLNLKAQLTALGHRVVGEAETPSQVLANVRNLHPEVVLLDLPPDAPAVLDTAQALLSENLAAVIIMTEATDAELLEKLEGLEIMGFLSKPLRSSDLRVVIPMALGRFQERTALEEEVKSLNDRMEARKLVGRAKAILMERHGLSERDAFKRIQSQSIALGKQAHEIAQAIITASEITMGGGLSPSNLVSSPTNSTEARSLPVRPLRGEKAALDAVQS